MSEPPTDEPMLVDSVYQRLITEIVEGALLPGQPIRQAKLAQRFGVSRAPVSHALQLLKQRGLVRESGGKGVEVAPVSAVTVRDLYQIRARMDGLAARLAAARVRFGEMPATGLAMLRDTYDVGMAGLGKKPIGVQLGNDIAFHQGIYAVCGNESIAAMMSPLWLHMQRAMVMVLSVGPERERAWQEHRDILDAIASGDPELADDRAFGHAANAGVYVENRLRGVI